MDRTTCTEPQCLYKGALYLLPCLKLSHVLRWYGRRRVQILARDSSLFFEAIKWRCGLRKLQFVQENLLPLLCNSLFVHRPNIRYYVYHIRLNIFFDIRTFCNSFFFFGVTLCLYNQQSDVHMSVHRQCISKVQPTRCNFISICSFL